MQYVLLLMVVVSSVFLQGCSEIEMESQSEKINSLKDKYEKSGNDEYAYEAINEVIKIEEYKYTLRAYNNGKDIYEDEEKSIIGIGELAFRKKDYRVAITAYKMLSKELSDDKKAFIEKEYKGNDDFVNAYIAQFYIQQGKIKSAYRKLEKISLNGVSSAPLIRYILKRFGCMDTDSIWAELTDKRENYYYGVGDFEIGGEDFHHSGISYDRETIKKMRIDLRNGKIPELQADCPIHQFE